MDKQDGKNNDQPTQEEGVIQMYIPTTWDEEGESLPIDFPYSGSQAEGAV